MTIRGIFQQRLADFSIAMETSPNRDLAIYRCLHAVLVFIAVLFVLAGFPSAVLPAILLSLFLTGQDAWQVFLSRRCSLLGLIVMAAYIIILFIAVPIAGLVGSFAGLSSFFVLLLSVGSLVLWFWSADRLYNSAFRIPPEANTGPW